MKLVPQNNIRYSLFSQANNKILCEASFQVIFVPCILNKKKEKEKKNK